MVRLTRGSKCSDLTGKRLVFSKNGLWGEVVPTGGSTVYEIRLQRSPKFDIVAAILNRTQQPGRVFETSFGPRDFKRLSTTTADYGCS